MRGPHNIIRLISTGATLERTGAMKVILDAFEAPTPLRWVLRGLTWPFQWLGLRGDPAMPPATRALTALGPAYIKFGQVLSTRPDVVGDELAAQLRVLQDKLPPFPVDVAKAEVERELVKIERKHEEDVRRLREEYEAELARVDGLMPLAEGHARERRERAFLAELILEGLHQSLKLARDDLDSGITYKELVKLQLLRPIIRGARTFSSVVSSGSRW